MCRPIIFSVLSLVLYSGTVNAASVVGSASLTVQNSFGFSQSKPLDFGKLPISRSERGISSTDTSFTLAPTGETYFIDKKETEELVGSGTPAVVNVINATPYTDLTLNVSDTVHLLHHSGITQVGSFSLTNVKAMVTGSQTEVSSGQTITTNLAGSLELSLGATVKFQGNRDYLDGIYHGTYSIELQY